MPILCNNITRSRFVILPSGNLYPSYKSLKIHHNVTRGKAQQRNISISVQPHFLFRVFVDIVTMFLYFIKQNSRILYQKNSTWLFVLRNVTNMRVESSTSPGRYCGRIKYTCNLLTSYKRVKNACKIHYMSASRVHLRNNVEHFLLS